MLWLVCPECPLLGQKIGLTRRIHDVYTTHLRDIYSVSIAGVKKMSISEAEGTIIIKGKAIALPY
jgi:hypothetical protein